jgi:hypothetical protein
MAKRNLKNLHVTTSMLSCPPSCAGSMLARSIVRWSKGAAAAGSGWTRPYLTRSGFVAAQVKRRRTWAVT